ncbi:Serine/threonine kinase family protein [Myxococcus hansupus]|uniref:Serine/threonine kinase family protein n=1 Tax=Pseudomyxococcus hansupus TaxID=1297742 RepID=A0A0H4WQ24_9BACT|nr:serine/threonine-protein kinase [Myxococcus hansupus]AKQ63410.1 Serine/threonine kinase family protein [Myxococcus hansupus]
MANTDDRGSGADDSPELSTQVVSEDAHGAPHTAEPSSARAAPGQASSRSPLGQRVGRFIPLKLLGQGGMGAVYAAYDPDLDRKVALKLLSVEARHLDEEGGRVRLLREAQAMARVSHPNVIPIYEVGTWDGQVFFTMELVSGGTLADWRREKVRSWREVLATYLQAGRGLEAAHAAGLVHRDFKPANVLVGRDGRVCVTDFGLARPVDNLPLDEHPTVARVPMCSEISRPLNEPLTETGVVLGTPPFMSPEQFRGEALDARSDQFSFCATLYRALYNQRPFDPDELSRAAKALRAGASLDAASLIHAPPAEPRVPAWVSRAVMRGLSLEPDARFPSMGALLEALSQDQHRARARKVGGMAVATAALVGVVGGALWWQSRVCAGAEGLLANSWGPAAKARVSTVFTATGSPLAGDMAARVGQVLDGYVSSWARQHTEACEATRVHEVQPEALYTQRVVCLERRRKDLHALVDALGRVEAAGVEKALDAAYALPSPDDCADVEALAGQQPRPSDPVLRAELESLEGGLSEVKALVDTSRHPQALATANALESRVLAARNPPLTAELRFHQGWLQAVLGEKEKGAGILELAVYDATVGRADRLEVLVLNKLLYVEGERERFEHAARWARLGKATLERLGGDAVLKGDLLVNEANLALMQGKTADARALLEEAAAVLTEALPPGHPKRARVTFSLGRVLLEDGAFAEAVRVMEEALRQTEAAVGPRHLDVARRHQGLSMALRELRQFTRALEHARASVALHRELLGASHLKLAEALDEEGMSLLALDRHEEALKVYEAALSVKLTQLAPDDEDLQYSYDGVGQALLGLGRTREALVPLRKAVAFTGAQEDSLGESGFALARALWKEGQGVEARAEAAKARERFAASGRTSQADAVRAWLEALPPEVKAKPVRGAPRRRR